MAAKIVVDSSVLIKWFKTKDEELLMEAQSLLQEVMNRPIEVQVPALLLYEVGSNLLLKTKLKPTAVESALEGLEALPFTVAPPATPLLKRAARLGREFDLTFYDASSLALAVVLDCPVITADRRLFDRSQPNPRVRHLSRLGALL
jgi:predicted nucleic acid-binding protein